jgi:putative two-component system response regulator
MTDTPDGKWLLVVEDDDYINKAYSAKLAHENIPVQFAVDGEEAMKILGGAKTVPSLILLDLMLPKMNGFEVLGGLKKDAKFKDIPVIVLTNLGQESDAERGKKLGAEEYLVKADTKIVDIVGKIKKYVTP